jgi:hypothetical protein
MRDGALQSAEQNRTLPGFHVVRATEGRYGRWFAPRACGAENAQQLQIQDLKFQRP